MKSISDGFILLTETNKTEQEAIADKMKALSPKLLGIFNPMPYELAAKRKVYIPYEFLTFSYKVNKGRNKNHLPDQSDKTGKVGVVFDVNEVHPFFFDLVEELKLKKTSVSSLDGERKPDQCSQETVLEKSTDAVRYKYLNRSMKSAIDLNLESRQKFYRQAFELTVVAHGKEMLRYAYMDIYGSMNENVSGLKIRLDV